MARRRDDPKLVSAVLQMRGSGMTQRAIATLTGCSISSVHRYLHPREKNGVPQEPARPTKKVPKHLLGDRPVCFVCHAPVAPGVDGHDHCRGRWGTKAA